jgi:hypothetical protein
MRNRVALQNETVLLNDTLDLRLLAYLLTSRRDGRDENTELRARGVEGDEQ